MGIIIKPISILFLCLSCIHLQAQLAAGQWKAHMSYVQGQKLAKSEHKVYCVTSGSLFSYGLNDNAIETYTKVTGLSDVYINDIAYCDKTGTLVICYDNGNIDLMSTDGITNIPDLKLKVIYGSKNINRIDIYDGHAYISTDFGIMKLNIEKAEISETYTLTSGEANPVNGITLLDDKIYAASNNGLFKANFNSLNLQNFAEWQQVTSIPLPSLPIVDITTFSDHIITAQKEENTESNDKYYIRAYLEQWRALDELEEFRSFGTNEEVLVIAKNETVERFNANFEKQATIESYSFAKPEYRSQYKIRCNAVIPISLNSLYLADNRQGLILYSEDDWERPIHPRGPASNTVWDIDISQNYVRTVHGALNDVYTYQLEPGAISTLHNGAWLFLDRKTIIPSTITDFVSIASNPMDENHYFVSSWVDGILEFKDNKIVEHFLSHNSSLSQVYDWVVIPKIVFDSDNRLWAINNFSNEHFHSLDGISTGEYTWTSYETPSAISNASLYDFVVTEEGYKWATNISHGEGILVLDENGSTDPADDRDKHFSVYAGSGGSASKITEQTHTIEIDKDGAIWVGHKMGLVVYNNPSSVFDSEQLVASHISVPRNDGTNLADYLMDNQYVLDIAVDGGNRKWIATANSGVYLVSPNGQEEIHHFTESNSPLLSNHVRAVEVNHFTGEVFFATEKGLISFQADATSGNSSFNNIRAYPNPVRENFFGDVTIIGLMEGSRVKITDVTGNLINETTSEGGTAIWNCKNFYGERVGTGVYLIFCSDKESKQSAMTKILVIN